MTTRISSWTVSQCPCDGTHLCRECHGPGNDEPDEDDIDFARETLPHGTEDEVYGLAVQRVAVRCAEEERGAGEV